MSWFQLDPRSLAQRASLPGHSRTPPSLVASVLRGTLGFCAVSVLGFVPWAFFGRSLGRVLGEAGMYAVCAVVFIALAGLFLHRLMLGEGSLGRFYRLFTPAFAAYSVAWIAGWMLWRGHLGGIVGLLVGTALMGWMFTRAFDAPEALLPVVATLFLTNTAGYFIGGWVEEHLMAMKELPLLGTTIPRGTRMRTAMLSWGVFYGLGLGAGLGYAFHRCQRAARQLLAADPGQTVRVSPSPSVGEGRAA